MPSQATKTAVDLYMVYRFGKNSRAMV